VTDFAPTVFAVDDSGEFCELCGEPDDGQLGVLGGVTVCEECAREYGSDLVQFGDAMREELRRL
jgi:ribosome-binding protein aMBF1 (putative translation factor)